MAKNDHDAETRASEEVGDDVEIYEDAPEFENAPWTQASEGVQDKEDLA